jgi:hypothetical protein
MNAAIESLTVNYLQPDYITVFRRRAWLLERMRVSDTAERLKVFYRNNPIQFISDWGMMYEPRNVEIGLPSKIPFVPFPRQVEWMQWVLDRWRKRQRGITLKSRGSGMSWSAVSLACTLCLFQRGINIGFGSRKAEYVDGIGDPKSLLWKARYFMKHLPAEFVDGWNEGEHSRLMRMMFPATECSIAGESGDEIGRGDRTALYFVDESGFLEHGEVAEGSLSDTSNCRIDISTSPGPGTVFADKWESLPEEQKFFFDYRDDPRRDQTWRERMAREISPEVFAREFEGALTVGGQFFAEDKWFVDGLPVPMPARCVLVFATADTALKSGKQHDGLGVLYCAVIENYVPTQHQSLVLLDYELLQIDSDLLLNFMTTAHAPAEDGSRAITPVYQRLEELARECGALLGSKGVIIEDKNSGTTLLQHLQRQGLPATAVDSAFVAMGKDERAVAISKYHHQGLCKIAKPCYEKLIQFKGASRNHLVSQVVAFRLADPMAHKRADDLVDAYTSALSATFGNSDGY